MIIVIHVQRSPPSRVPDRLRSRGVGAALLALLAVTALGCSRHPPDPVPALEASSPPAEAAPAKPPSSARVIVFVWDGLRPDSVNPRDTPNLVRLGKTGVVFRDHHATFPTFTMINAASLATGAYPATAGFYGNSLYRPAASRGPAAGAKNSLGAIIDFSQPVFTEDHGVLSALNASFDDRLLLVDTLEQAAQKAGLTTASVGKSGPTFLLDVRKGGAFVDERAVFPARLAADLRAAGYPLPRTTPLAYPAGEVTLSESNGDPTASPPSKKLADGVTADPDDESGSPNDAANRFLFDVYSKFLLPRARPDLTFLWLRSPDTAQHAYGPNTPNARAAIRAQDALLGDLEARLEALGLDRTTDVVVVSDHGHSSIAGDRRSFPLRALKGPGSEVHSVSGDVRLADLLTRAGFQAFDGQGCLYDPAMSGQKADGTFVYPPRTDDGAGSFCKKPDQPFSTGSFMVPPSLPPGAVVVAANGGSDYLYVPDHDPKTVTSVVRALQSREELGPIFVSRRYGAVPGTLGLDLVRLEPPDPGPAPRAPDLVASYAFDEQAQVSGFPGTEYASMQSYRGMHGTFGPTDVHATLIAWGPHFARGLEDTLPSGNVDVAPTVAAILGVALPAADGRALREALVLAGAGVPLTAFTVTPRTVEAPAAARGLRVVRPTRPDGGDVDRSVTTYRVELRSKVLRGFGETYTYFDSAYGRRR